MKDCSKTDLFWKGNILSICDQQKPVPIANALKGKRVLITGGTGSFGHAVVRRFLKEGSFLEIRIFSRDELKQELMRQELNDPRLKFYIGDTRDRASVDSAMDSVDWVFHAAALKQVPSCEFFPLQAVMTNILGSSNVIQSAIEHQVKRVVCLSTDKAVYPINAMGMTKALMEKTAQAASREIQEEDTCICIVRYGNVMASRGSVIPLFLRQIQERVPLTITDPAMTRFLMTLQDATDLVLFALSKSQQGDLLIRKSPACTIGDLAQAMLTLLHASNPVRIIGVRHGEKKFETLATVKELLAAEDLGNYYRVRMDTRDLNYNKYFSEGEISQRIVEDYTSDNTQRLDQEGVMKLLRQLPEIQAVLKDQ